MVGPSYDGRMVLNVGAEWFDLPLVVAAETLVSQMFSVVRKDSDEYRELLEWLESPPDSMMTQDEIDEREDRALFDMLGINYPE